MIHDFPAYVFNKMGCRRVGLRFTGLRLTAMSSCLGTRSKNSISNRQEAWVTFWLTSLLLVSWVTSLIRVSRTRSPTSFGSGPRLVRF